MKSRRCSRNAFTIVELLVVIAIIGILLALLLPATNRPRMKAYVAYCINNVRQINMGIHMYLEDQLNNSPGNTNTARSPFLTWTDYRRLIDGYVGPKPRSPSDSVFACPKDTFYYALSSKDPPVTRTPLHENSNYVFTSYAYNAGMVTTRPTTNADGTVTPGTTNFYGIAGLRMESIVHPSRTVLIAEIPAFAPYSWHSPKKPLSEKNSKFNDSRNIVSFVDGHAAYIKMYYNGQKLAWDYNPPAGYEYQWTGD
jgi:prepilin-type N-terminal cleavage/methylation domain-containing protein